MSRVWSSEAVGGLRKRRDWWRRVAVGIALGWGLGPSVPVARGQHESGAAASQPVSPATWLRVTANEVHLRSRPDQNSVAVARVDRDTVLQAVARDPYGWYQVVPPPGVFSLVAVEYIDRRSATEGVVSTRSGTLRVRVGSLLYEVDPLKMEVQARLERGAKVQITGEQGDWLKIEPPPGVFLHVSGEFVTPVSEDVAARLRTATSRPVRAAESVPAKAAAARPAAGPDLSGPWGQKLVQVEALIETEGSKPLAEQVWDQPLALLEPLAAQRQEPMVARLARAWIEQLRRQVADKAAVQAAEQTLRQSARGRARFEREQARIERLRHAATRPACDARGELIRSSIGGEPAGQPRYKLQDPLTRRLEAYIELAPQAKADLERLVGQYVGVWGRRRFDTVLGADILTAEKIEVLKWQRPTTQPARRTP